MSGLARSGKSGKQIERSAEWRQVLGRGAQHYNEDRHDELVREIDAFLRAAFTEPAPRTR